jgi:hypothetical protein
MLNLGSVVVCLCMIVKAIMCISAVTIVLGSTQPNLFPSNVTYSFQFMFMYDYKGHHVH